MTQLLTPHAATAEVWTVGRPGCVVSDTKQRSNDDQRDVDYYGGYCVAESITSREKALILAASLDLLAAAKALVDAIDSAGFEAGALLESMPQLIAIADARRLALNAIAKAGG